MKSGFWLSALDLFLHDFLKYSIYCPNILSPNMDMVVLSLSYLTLSTPWTVAHQAPPPMGFSRQEYWSGLPFPSPGNLPSPVIKLVPLALAGRFFTIDPLGKPSNSLMGCKILTLQNCPSFKSNVYLQFVCHISAWPLHLSKFPSTSLTFPLFPPS